MTHKSTTKLLIIIIKEIKHNNYFEQLYIHVYTIEIIIIIIIIIIIMII